LIDVAKTSALIDAFLTTLNNQFPQLLSGYHYDFNKRGFYDRLGRPLDAARLERGEGTPASRGARAGSRTARRGIFLQSLVSSESSQRPSILADILRRGYSLVRDGQLTALLSQKSANQPNGGISSSKTRTILNERFGEKTIKALESSGLLTIMATPPSWAEPDTDGAYHNGKSYLFASNLTPETVVATFIHELGGHKGFQELMTPTAYDSLMRQFNRLVKQGNAIALAAKARAEAAESTLGAQQDEYLPYLLTQQATINATRTQRMSVNKLIEQAKRAVKAWLFNLLSKYGYDAKAARLSESFTPEDMIVLAERMIRNMGNGTNLSNNTNAKGSQFSQLNTPLDPVNTTNILNGLLRGFTTKANAVRDSAVLRIRVDKSFSNLPLAIQEEAKKQGSDGNDIKGVFHNNTLGKSGAPNQWDCIYRRLG
jgi:hypothetical protein